MKKSFALTVSLLLSLSLPSFAGSLKECEKSPDGIMSAYNSLLAKKDSDGALSCLLKIHREASGILKSLAVAALRPVMGGAPLAGRKLNAENKALTKALVDQALSDDKMLQDYAAGTWGFYDLFCQGKNIESCVLFLPEESQVMGESALIGSSSMLLLRTAYLHLKGADKKLVEDRLRGLYLKISTNETLKRKTIESIYQELFGVRLPLGQLS